MIKYYPFELHCHTLHSDGDMSPQELVLYAKQRKLTGIALTDHNTVSATAAVISAAQREGLVVIKGIEWTTFWGHMTVLGGNSRVDWRQVNLDTINEKITEARQAGDLVCMAHPYRPGGWLCTGCYFDFEIDYNNLDAFEIWSGINPKLSLSNAKAYDEYKRLINAGYKPAAVYGYDWHKPIKPGESYCATLLGIEGEPNEASALQAIACGRTAFGEGASAVLRLVDENGNSYYHGAEVPAGTYTPIAELYSVGHSVEKPEEFSITLSGSALADTVTKALPAERVPVFLPQIVLKEGSLFVETYANTAGASRLIGICNPFRVKK